MRTQESDGAPDQSTAAKVDPVTAAYGSAPWSDLAAVHRYVDPFLAGVGTFPGLGSPDWCALDDGARRKHAALVVAALSRLVLPADVVAEVQCLAEARADKDAALAISAAEDWSAIASHPSHAELERRRAQPGPLAHTIDPDEVRRWVATGSSRAGGEVGSMSVPYGQEHPEAQQWADEDGVVHGWVDRDGAALLEQVHAFAGRFLALPSPAALDAFVLWLAHAHVIDCFESTPRIAFLSPEPESGKTRTLEIADLLVPHPMHAVNCSPPALFRAINDLENRPTILYDEIDTVFGPKAKENEEVRGLLNAGHRRGAVAYRCVGEGTNQKVAAFPAYAPVALAGIGDLPDTILGRSIVIQMHRRAPGEHVEPFRHRLHASAGHELRDRLATWTEQHVDVLQDHFPVLPEGVSDRPADVWEPLLAIAETAGGDWPERARRACAELVNAARSNDSGSLGLRLLADIRRVFAGTDQDEPQRLDKISTEHLLDRLHHIDDAPWGDLRGKPLDARGLARRLKPYGVTSKKIDLVGTKRQGYAAEAFHDPWNRYLPAVSPTEAEHPEPPERPSAQGADLVPDNNQVPDTAGTNGQSGTRTTPFDQGSSSSSGSSTLLREDAGAAHLAPPREDKGTASQRPHDGFNRAATADAVFELTRQLGARPLQPDEKGEQP